MAPLIVDKEAKKKLILDAALEVFISKGYHNVTVSDIARRAGISKGSLYVYFRSREELFRELFDYMARYHREHFLKKMASGLSAEEKVRDIIAYYVRSYDRREKFLYILIDYIAHNRASDERHFYKRTLADIYARFIKEVSSVITEGIETGAFRTVDVEAVAHSILTVADGMMFQHFFVNSASGLEKIEAVLADMILCYIVKR